MIYAYLKNPIFKAHFPCCGGDECFGLCDWWIRKGLHDGKRSLEKDIDIVVTGSGIDFARKVADELGSDVPVKYFKNFGTAMLKSGDIQVEFVGARKESYQRDSRKPVVENGTIEEDQNRRDFTINAMAFDLGKKNFGNLVDPFNGISDIREKIIRTPLDPDITFSDDPLRMMRAIRFACQLGFHHQHRLL